MARQSMFSRPGLALTSLALLMIIGFGTVHTGCSKSRSNKGGTVATTGSLSVTISGGNSVDSEGTLNLSASATGTASGSTLEFQWNQTSGANGTFTDEMNSSTDWTAPVAAQSDENVVIQVTVTEKDADGNVLQSKTETLNVTVNAPPTLSVTTASASVSSLQGGGSFNLDGTVTGGKAPYTFTWNQVSGNSSVVTIVTPITNQSGTNVATQVDTSLVSQVEPVEFVLTVEDAYGVQASSAAIKVDINPPPPIDVVVTLTPTAVQGGQDITASAVVSGGLGGSYTYQWNQLSGPLVTFSDPTSVSTTVMTPVVTADSPIVLQLTATDASGSGSGSETATLTVTPIPLVITSVTATPSDLPSGGSTTLVAVISGGNGPISVSWTQTVGSGIMFANPTLASTSATMPTVTGATSNFKVQVTVTDNNGPVTATVDLVVNPLLGLSSLTATPSSVQDGQSSTLSATLTGGTGALTHSWTQTAGQPASIANPTSQSTSVMVAAGTPPQTLVFQYQGSDSVGGLVTGTVNLTVTASPPGLQITSITAAPNDVPSGGSSNLSVATSGGSGTVTYLWELISGTGAVIASPTASSTGVTFPAVTGSTQTFTFRCTATDSLGSVSSTVNVTVNPLLSITSLTASPASIQDGQSSTLAAVTSGGTGTLTHAWTQTAGTPVTIVSPSLPSTVVNVPAGTAPQTLTFQYAVTDSTGTVTSTVNLTVTAAPTPLTIVSVTASPTSVQDGQSSTLTGVISGGTPPVSHAWTQTAGTPVTIVSPTSPSTVVNVPAGTAPQILTFQYAATDVNGTVTDTVNLTVTTAPGGGAPVLTSLSVVAGVDSRTIANGETSQVVINYTLSGGGPGSSTLTVNSGEPMTIALVGESTVGNVYSATYSVTPLGDPANVTALNPGATVLDPSCTDAGNGQSSSQTLRTLNVHRQSPFKNITGIQANSVQADHPLRTVNLGPGMFALGATTIISANEVDQEIYLAVPDNWESLSSFGITVGQQPFVFLNPFENPGLFTPSDFRGRPFLNEVTAGIPAGWRVFHWVSRMRTDAGRYLVYFCRDGSTATPDLNGTIDPGDANIVYFVAGMEHNHIYDIDSAAAGDIVDGHKGFMVSFSGQTPVLAAAPPTKAQP